jgi:hypothetical protein
MSSATPLFRLMDSVSGSWRNRNSESAQHADNCPGLLGIKWMFLPRDKVRSPANVRWTDAPVEANVLTSGGRMRSHFVVLGIVAMAAMGTLHSSNHNRM